MYIHMIYIYIYIYIYREREIHIYIYIYMSWDAMHCDRMRMRCDGEATSRLRTVLSL